MMLQHMAPKEKILPTFSQEKTWEQHSPLKNTVDDDSRGFYRLAIVGGTNVMALMVRETALAAHGSVLLANNGIFEYVSFWPFLVVVISILLCLGICC